MEVVISTFVNKDTISYNNNNNNDGKKVYLAVIIILVVMYLFYLLVRGGGGSFLINRFKNSYKQKKNMTLSSDLYRLSFEDIQYI